MEIGSHIVKGDPFDKKTRKIWEPERSKLNTRRNHTHKSFRKLIRLSGFYSLALQLHEVFHSTWFAYKLVRILCSIHANVLPYLLLIWFTFINQCSAINKQNYCIVNVWFRSLDRYMLFEIRNSPITTSKYHYLWVIEYYLLYNGYHLSS